MADPLTPEQRRKVMRSNRGKDTKLELVARRGLHARGLRYRLHGSKLIGSPDLVFKGSRAVVYLHGCFWHRHPGCNNAPKVDSGHHTDWAGKFQVNIARDKRNIERAHEAGYRVAVLWECAVEQKKRESKKREVALDRLAAWLRGDPSDEYLELG